mmetsp:Transcript_5894/g.14032  ORF Transcript_5894/g.14032 Transcript_5894/m.14032 type:complete len:109 (-) Transcript_5894:3129-3455(-)
MLFLSLLEESFHVYFSITGGMGSVTGYQTEKEQTCLVRFPPVTRHKTQYNTEADTTHLCSDTEGGEGGENVDLEKGPNLHGGHLGGTGNPSDLLVTRSQLECLGAGGQ